MKKFLSLIAPFVVWASPFLIWSAKFSPYFHIKNKDGSPYMDRWWLIKARWITGGWGIRVHHIRSSDDDRALHDHPWAWGTIICKSGYFEVLAVFETRVAAANAARAWGFTWLYEKQTGKYVMGRHLFPGSVTWRTPEAFHRLRLYEAGGSVRSAWTIFITGPRVQGWGFLDKGNKVPWREYVAERFGDDHVKRTSRELAKAWGKPPKFDTGAR